MRRVSLREHGRLLRTQGDVDDDGISARAYERLRRFDERRARDDGPVFTWYAHHAKASQWVGVLEVDDLQVEILPKIQDMDDLESSRLSLLAMLSIAGALPVRSRDLAALAERRASLSDTLARLFAERLIEELLRGPERRYRQRRENLHAFKGKLIVREQVLRNAAHRERFVLEFDELGMDTAMNRVFRAACLHLLATSRSSRACDALRRGLTLLDEVSDAVITEAHLDGVTVDRQNERFEPLLEFCRLLFRGRSPTARAGSTRSFSLLFDMNVVFERFVTAFVRRFVMPTLPGWQLFPQSAKRRRHLLRRGSRGVLQLAPDLLFQDPDGGLLVVDTKWKHLGASGSQRRASREDLFQLYAYAQRFGALRSVLLYPHAAGLEPDELTLLGESEPPSGRVIESRFVRLGRDLSTAAGRAELTSELRRILTSRDGARA